MTLKRRSTLIKNKYKAADSSIILLVGSENGSSIRFANVLLKQLIDQGHKVFLAELNRFTVYPKAEHLILLTSTHGLGDAPSNATKFKTLIQKLPQQQKIKFSVVGFGSRSYPDFCKFAIEIDALLDNQTWSERFLALQTVNDKSAVEFVDWIKLWSAKTGIPLATTPSLYNHVPKGLQKLMVLNKTLVSDTEHTFILTLKTNARTSFSSGDLLAIYPANDSRERLYSIGKHTGNIQLVVKLHPHGLGSEFLNQLEVGNTFNAQIINNKAFHFPSKAYKVAFISNGTGIAPFLGMIEQNNKKIETHLYSGFRLETETVTAYKTFSDEMIQKQKLTAFHLALSREAEAIYVMNLIKRDAAFFVDLLKQNGVIMICGSIAMQKDVELILENLCQEAGIENLDYYKYNQQLLTDCY